MKVYKYFAKQYETSTQMGWTHLSTFSNIKKIDSSKKIGDPEEAKVVDKVDLIAFSDASAPSAAHAVKFLDERGIKIVAGGRGYLKDLNFIRHLPDAYMYCVTKERNDKYWKKAGYDCCMEIKDFRRFSALIWDALKKQKIITKIATDECFFESNVGFYERDLKDPSYFRKSVDHKPQKEIRSVFVPFDKSLKLSPKRVLIDYKDLITFLK